MNSDSSLMKERLNRVLKDILKCDMPPEEATTENTLNWDSFGHLNLILALEQEFKIKIPPNELGLLYKDYKAVSAYIEERLQSKKP